MHPFPVEVYMVNVDMRVIWTLAAVILAITVYSIIRRKEIVVEKPRAVSSRLWTWAVPAVLVLLLIFFISPSCSSHKAVSTGVPTPLLSADRPVDWWVVFKFNSSNFPGCSGVAERACPFGGEVQQYSEFSRQFVYASSENESLRDGFGCLGNSTLDPVGATFDKVYNGDLNYVVWNDQFYNDPHIDGCTNDCGSPWGHSKGVLAWNAEGAGFVMQVSTPSWPAAGNKSWPRMTDGNTLGCIKDNNVLVSQHFFSLALNRGDVAKVLAALANASVVTDTTNPQLVRNGGPEEIQQLVRALGRESSSGNFIASTFSSGVLLISKPSLLHVPPWQMVSAILGGTSLRVATWWSAPEIYSTTAATPVGCWDASLGSPGAVEIATTGHWEGRTLGLTGGDGADFNHAKIGVSTSGSVPYVIFGDMNQQGSLSPPECGSSQNGRGGLFFVLKKQKLHDEIAGLIAGSSAPIVQ